MFGRTGESNPRFGITHTEETKALISEAFSGENHPFFGKTHTAETKNKLREANLGKSPSAETRALISAAKGTAIYVYDLEGRLVNSFTSDRRSALHFGVSKDTILKYVKNSIIFQEKWKLTTFPAPLGNNSRATKYYYISVVLSSYSTFVTTPIMANIF